VSGALAGHLSIFAFVQEVEITERLDVGRCREALLGVWRRAKRNKVFAKSRFIGLAVDGSTGCRRRQAVPSCLRRSWKNAQEQVVGYRRRRTRRRAHFWRP
jgi:hypothetical protein